MQYLQKLDETERRFEELTRQMTDADVISDLDAYHKTAKAHSDLSDLVGKYREWKKAADAISQARPMLEEKDPDLRAMAEEEIAQLEPEMLRIEDQLKVLLLPKDPLDDKNVVLEIRAGTGGDEATLFAAEIFRPAFIDGTAVTIAISRNVSASRLSAFEPGLIAFMCASR